MTVSMYTVSIPVFVRTLNNLAHILKKGEEHGVDLGARLAADMHPLPRQIQIASDIAKGGAARLAGVDVPSWPDTETTYPELQERIAKTIAFLHTLTAAQIDGTEDKTITLKFPGREMNFTGETFLIGFTLPNLYFHVTTTYAILRQAGVPLGKMDYMGGM